MSAGVPIIVARRAVRAEENLRLLDRKIESLEKIRDFPSSGITITVASNAGESSLGFVPWRSGAATVNAVLDAARAQRDQLVAEIEEAGFTLAADE